MAGYFELNTGKEESDDTVNKLDKCNEISWWNELPTEVMAHLLHYLPYPDRTSLGLVSQQLNLLCLDRKYIDKEQVVFNSVQLFSETAPVNIFLNSSREFKNFVLIQVELNDKIDSFWKKFAPSIKSLAIRECTGKVNYLTSLLTNFRELEYLEINNCRDFFICGTFLSKEDDVQLVSKALRTVQSLNLSFNRYLSDALFNRLVTVMGNLKSLNLSGSQISFHPVLFKRFYFNRDLNDGSETVLTFGNLCAYLEKTADQFQVFDFSYTLINSKSLERISELSNLNLTEMYLHNCEQLANDGVKALAKSQVMLRKLDVSGCSRLTDLSLICICENLPKLKLLSVSCCRGMTDLGIGELHKLTELEYLDLSHCEQVTGHGIERALCSSVKYKLEHLYLKSLNLLLDTTVILLAEYVPNLLSLDLSNCLTAVTDNSIQSIFKNLVLLRSLKLGLCGALTDAGLTGTKIEESNKLVPFGSNSAAASNKHYISLRSKAEEDIVGDAQRKRTVKLMCAQSSNDQGPCYSLANLKGLRVLDLQNCNRITDVAIEYSFKLPELQSLNIRKCQQITDFGLLCIAKNNRSIEELNLSYCLNITDRGISAIVENLPRLKYIDLLGCVQLTDIGLEAIKRNCLMLRFLDIRNCKMTPESVDLSSMTALHLLRASTSSTGSANTNNQQSEIQDLTT